MVAVEVFEREGGFAKGDFYGFGSELGDVGLAVYKLFLLLAEVVRQEDLRI